MTTTEFFRDDLRRYLLALRELVALESPTGDVDRARRAAAWLADRFSDLADVDSEELAGFGPMLRVHHGGSGPKVLLLAHYDTVWPVGSWSDPWLERGGRIHGPGVYDMKSGLLFSLWLLHWAKARGRRLPDLEILLNPDEEVGSRSSRTAIEAAALASDLVLVLEPATPDGRLKLERKGSGEYLLEIVGRSAHQGVAPEHGINAVVEAAHQILRMLELGDPEAGTTVGPNVIHGGDASNTVPDRVRIAIDVRAWTVSDQRRLDAALRALEPVLDGASLGLTGQWNRPPMESSPASVAIFERARRVGAGLGLEVGRAAWGGSSDANLTAALGVPTVDGFGPTGGGAHQPSEHVVVDGLPVRMALFAEVVASFADEDPRALMTGGQRSSRLDAQRTTSDDGSP
jgi:glutamate carboxypeptidase